MKHLCLLAFAGCLAAPVFAALEFSGYVRSGEALQFIVTDTDTGNASGFLALGRTFKGHKLVAFEAEPEVLVVEREGQTVRLPLKDARVRDGKSAAPPKPGLRIDIARDGMPSHVGQPLNLGAFKYLLQIRVKSGDPVALVIHQPPAPGPEVHATIKLLHTALAESGVKKWSIKIMDAPPASP